MSNNSNNTSVISGKVKNKKKGLNFVDFLLILIVIAIIGGIVYMFSPISFLKKATSAVEGTLDYTIEIRNVDVSFIDNIKENDIVIDSVSKNTLGTVSAVDHNTKYAELGYQIVEQEQEKYEGFMMEYPDRYNVIVTITANANYIAGQGYDVNNCRIAVGEKLYLRFSDYVCEGYCVYVTPTEDFK